MHIRSAKRLRDEDPDPSRNGSPRHAHIKTLPGHFGPSDPLVGPLLTDFYEITMAYGYWKSGKANDHAVFELFFRKNPFHGEYTIVAGLEECLQFISNYHFTSEDIDYLRTVMPQCEKEFFIWLSQLNCREVKVYAMKEGSACFPNVPLLRIEGPLVICQLLETTLLCLVNYASLVTTNAVRYRQAAGPKAILLEFGLRRAQGPDGGVSASRYSYIGGFDGTSNVLAGKLFDIAIRGTHAHSFVTSFVGLNDIRPENQTLKSKDGKTEKNLVTTVNGIRAKMNLTNTNEGDLRKTSAELAAFITYAIAWPDNFLALVDTYDTILSGVPNFLCVSVALHELGYQAAGIRLDSGDLAYLAKKTRALFQEWATKLNIESLATMKIFASNDINEETLRSLCAQTHQIDGFGIGTNLVTCSAQPALGCVYKLVEINGQPRMKLSQEFNKITIPAKKVAYRLIGQKHPVIDLLIREGYDTVPKVGEPVMCRHPFEETKRVIVRPTKVIPLHLLVFDCGKICKHSADGNNKKGNSESVTPPLDEVRAFVASEIAQMREDHLRTLNPTPYKVSVTDGLYNFMHSLWLKEIAIKELD